MDDLKCPSAFKEIPVPRVDIDDDGAIVCSGAPGQPIRNRSHDSRIERVIKVADETARRRIEFSGITAQRDDVTRLLAG